MVNRGNRVDYQAVKRGEAAPVRADDLPQDLKRAVGGGRYDLATALQVVRRMETSATRGAVFDEIKAKNPLYRLVDTIYATARPLQPLALFAYMLKSILSVGPFDDRPAGVVTLSNFDNERHAIDRVVALTPDLPLLRLSMKRSHLVGKGQGRALMRMVGSLRRVWPFLSTLARTHSFMPAARIASGLAYYMRFSDLFEARPDLRSAIVASNYSPEALGMAAAAHAAGRRLVYANHAPIPANAPSVPPVLAECAVLYGDASRLTYEKKSRCRAQVALIGQPWTARAMRWQDGVRTVGIFLTALTRPGAVAKLVADIRAADPDVQIIIRNHPVALLKNDLSAFIPADPGLSITIGNPLDDEIAACDLIFCGNSGVAMNALSGGRPVAYLGALDGLAYDYNGFVESGLICPVDGWSDGLYAALKRFYQRAEWVEVMRSYDASYETDIAALHAEASAVLRRFLA